jgi:hypothetical protein
MTAALLLKAAVARRHAPCRISSIEELIRTPWQKEQHRKQSVTTAKAMTMPKTITGGIAGMVNAQSTENRLATFPKKAWSDNTE